MMTAVEYIKSHSAKERVKLLLKNYPLATIGLSETIENCMAIINCLDDLKDDQIGTNRYLNDTLKTYNDQNGLIISQLLYRAFTIDLSFRLALNFLYEYSLPRINIRDAIEMSYLIFLDNSDLEQSIDTQESYPEYYFALCEKILICLGKSIGPIDDSKKGIMAYGRNKYKFSTTGERFYAEYKAIEIKNMIAEVKSMHKKYRSIWKSIIIKISKDDADVIAWLKNQPN